MKIYCYCFFSLFLLPFIPSAQNPQKHPLYLSTGTIFPEKNTSEARIAALNRVVDKTDEKKYCIIQLEQLATAAMREEMQQSGIVLLEYIPADAYLVAINGPLQTSLLKKWKARAIIELEPLQKIEPALQAEQGSNKSIKVWVAFFNGTANNESIASLKQLGYTVTATDNLLYNVAELNVNSNNLMQLVSLPFIKYIAAAPAAAAPLNFESRNLSRANTLQATGPGGYNLSGKGIVIGVTEVGGPPQQHVDIMDRMVPGDPNAKDYHSTHVNGIIGGAGLIDERYKGYAPGATLYCGMGGIGSLAPLYFQRYGMVLTNNSLAAGPSCNQGPTSLAQTVYDMQAYSWPLLQNVYAAGNSGGLNCNNGYPAGFNTALGSNAGGKSGISVGNTKKNGELYRVHHADQPPADGLNQTWWHRARILFPPYQ